MSGFEIIMAVLAYTIFGMIVVEAAHWSGVRTTAATILFWPLIALSALFGRNGDQ
jgi:uncharacterized membrane protein